MMQTLADISGLFFKYGQKPYGEQVTQLQHAVQVAHLAEQAGASEALVAAALLHDVGHLLYNDEMAHANLNDRHEALGGQLLERLFGLNVAEPVRLHVLAKRYLCVVDEAYYEGLSAASKHSLELQGGRLSTAAQIQSFEQNPYFEDAVQLRLWDDQGKNSADLDTDFKRYLPLLQSLERS